MHWTVREIARALGVPPPSGAPGETPVARVETDSREVGPGDLFVALPGRSTDGHRFLRSAARAGAALLVAGRGRSQEAGPGAPPVLEVDDPLVAYRRLAYVWRGRAGSRRAGPAPVPAIAAVAGSVGKTTSTALVAALLEGAFPGAVHRTPPQRNGWVGLPKTLLALCPERHRAAVLEVGTDAPGMTWEQVTMVRPDVLLVTAIAEEHLDRLGDLEGVAAEQGQGFRGAVAGGGMLVVNEDDPRVLAQAEAALTGAPDAPRAIRFRLASEAAPGPERLVGEWSAGPAGGGRLTVVGGPWAAPVAFPVPLPGVHQARNLLGALATAVALGVTDPGQLRTGLEGFRPPPGRSELRQLPGGATVLADHYNASPASVRAALASARQLLDAPGGPTRLVLVLGDMLELGTDQEGHHRRLAEPVLEARPAAVHLLGERMTWLADALLRAGAPVHHHSSPALLGAALAPELQRPKTLVLLKASRGIALEAALPELDLAIR